MLKCHNLTILDKNNCKNFFCFFILSIHSTTSRDISTASRVDLACSRVDACRVHSTDNRDILIHYRAHSTSRLVVDISVGYVDNLSSSLD